MALPEERVDLIIEEYKERGSYAAVARETGHSKSTVRKYVTERLPDSEIEKYRDGGDSNGDSNGEESEADSEDRDDEDETPPGFTAPPPSNSRPSEDPHESQDFESMGPDDFILWFFDHSGHGVRGDFARNLSEHCRVRGEIPDKSEMQMRLNNQRSGISNDGDVQMIADNYWAAAKRWAKANNIPVPGVQQNQGGGYTGGQWYSAESQGDGRAQNGAGSWLSAEGQSREAARAQPPQQGRQPQGRQPQQGGPPGQSTDPEIRELRESVKELKEAQMAMLRQNRQQSRDGGGNSGVESLKNQFRQMVELQDTLQEMGANNKDDDELEMVKQQLGRLQQELERTAQEQGAEGQVVPAAGGNSDFAALAQMAQSGDMDTELLSVMADAMGVTDPEVKKAEYEFKKEEKRMENRREMIDQVFENLGDVSGDLVSGVLGALASQQQQAQQPQQQQQAQGQGQQQPQRQPQEQPRAQPEEEIQFGGPGGARPAGDTNLQDGEIQVVGDEGGINPPESQEGSAARRRLEEMAEEAAMEEAEMEHEDEDEEPIGGGFRSPGGD